MEMLKTELKIMTNQKIHPPLPHLDNQLGLEEDCSEISA